MNLIQSTRFVDKSFHQHDETCVKFASRQQAYFACGKPLSSRVVIDLLPVNYNIIFLDNGKPKFVTNAEFKVLLNAYLKLHKTCAITPKIKNYAFRTGSLCSDCKS